MGRPTKYLPEFCERAVELGKLGKSIVQIACDFGVLKSAVYDWMKEYPDFSNAMEQARLYSEAYWEEITQRHSSVGSNVAGAKYYMNVRFGWREVQEVHSETKLAVTGSISLAQALAQVDNEADS